MKFYLLNVFSKKLTTLTGTDQEGFAVQFHRFRLFLVAYLEAYSEIISFEERLNDTAGMDRALAPLILAHTLPHSDDPFFLQSIVPRSEIYPILSMIEPFGICLSSAQQERPLLPRQSN